MGTEYRTLYDGVLAKIKDYDFFKLSESEVYGILQDYIRPAIVRFQSCKKNLALRDEDGFEEELSDVEIEILCNFMVVEYLDSNYIRSQAAMKQVLSNKDFNTYSPANLLDKTMAVRSSFLAEARQLMRDYSYQDSSLFHINEEKGGVI